MTTVSTRVIKYNWKALSCIGKQQQQPTQAFSSVQKFQEEWLKFLVCPVSKQTLYYDSERDELFNQSIKYPIRDGIPLLTPWDKSVVDQGEQVASTKEQQQQRE